MPGLILGVVARLEQQLENCPDSTYVPDWPHRVWLAVSLVPVFAFVVVTYLSWTQRYLFYWMLGIGIWVNSAIIWVLQLWIPPLEIPNTCVHSLRTRPADDAAALWLMFVYYYVYVLRKQGRLALNDMKTWRLLLLGLSASLSSFALCYIGLYTTPEVLLGSTIGAVSGMVLCVVLYLYIVPKFQEHTVQYVLEKLHIHRHAIEDF